MLLPFRRSLLFTALMLGVLPATAFAQGGSRVVTLRDAVAVGVSTNPEYGTLANNRRATDEELVQAKAGFLPSVDASADTGWEWTREHPDGAGHTTESLWRASAGVTLTQMLFDGFDTRYEVMRQKSRVASSAYRTWELSEFLGLDIVEAYLDVLRQRELLNIARTNVSRHLDIERQILDSATAGRTTQADVEQARARSSSARAAEANVREALRLAEATYQRKVGEMPGILQRPPSPASTLSQTVAEEVNRALVGSPTLAALEADVDTAAAEWQQSKSTFYPQVDFQTGVTHAHDTGGTEGEADTAQALVIMNWNLYRGGADTARTREQVYRQAQAKETRANAARALEEDVRQTWAKMIAAGERSKEFDAQAGANRQVVEAYFDQFNLDRRTLLDVLDAQNEYFVSESNRINSQYLEMFAMFRLLTLKGQLLPQLAIPYPSGVDPNDNERSPLEAAR